jgi:hypothetical protein
MRKLVFTALAAGLLAFDWSAASAATPAKKNAPPKTASAKSAPAAKKSAAAKSASTHKSGKKTSAKAKTTWRNRQMAPSPERYKEIQDALVAKGYLRSEEATGVWTSESAEALKRFQADQNIESSGKINSLSLIALGLGPKHDSTAGGKPPAAPVSQTDQSDSSR